MTSYINSFGVCNWFPEHGAHLVAKEDVYSFASLSPAGKVFYCTDMRDGWLHIQYGSNSYCVSAEVFKPVAVPAFKVGQAVIAGGKNGVVEHVSWHFKNEVPIYLLAFGGKSSSRRYDEADLKPLD